MRDGGEAALAVCQRHAVRHPKRRARLFARRRAPPGGSRPPAGPGWAETVAAERWRQNPDVGSQDIGSGPAHATRARIRAPAAVVRGPDPTVRHAGTTHPTAGLGTVQSNTRADSRRQATGACTPERVPWGGWGGRSGRGRRCRAPSSAHANRLTSTRATAGAPGRQAPARSHRPVRPRAWCTGPSAPALSRRGGWTRGAGATPTGPRSAAAPKVSGAVRREPRRGSDGPRGRRPPPWSPAPAPSPARRSGPRAGPPPGHRHARARPWGAAAGRPPAARRGQRRLATAPTPPPCAAPGAWRRRTRRPVTAGRWAGTRVPWARWRGDIAWCSGGCRQAVRLRRGACRRRSGDETPWRWTGSGGADAPPHDGGPCRSRPGWCGRRCTSRVAHAVDEAAPRPSAANAATPPQDGAEPRTTRRMRRPDEGRRAWQSHHRAGLPTAARMHRGHRYRSDRQCVRENCIMLRAYRLAQALPTIQVPATVQAVLAARSTGCRQRRSAPANRRRHRYRGALAAAPGHCGPTRVTLHRGLAHLQAAEFLYETRLFPEPTLPSSTP